MEIKYCWRCKMDIPMLDKEEFEIASKLYSKGFIKENENLQERFKELLEYYNSLTGFGETEPNAIMHHAIKQIGSDCENCGKPYRTPKATLCVACGNKKNMKNKNALQQPFSNIASFVVNSRIRFARLFTFSRK